MSHLFVGLDVSIAHTGFVVLDEAGEILKRGVLHSPATYPDITRFIKNSEELMLRMGLPTTQKVLVNMEEYAFSATGQMTRIAEFGGLVKFNLIRSGVHWWNLWTCAPGTLKVFATGKGQCEKSLIIKEVFKRFGFDTTDDNEADAFVLARMLWKARTDQSLTKDELRAVQALFKTNFKEIEHGEDATLQARVTKPKPKGKKRFAKTEPRAFASKPTSGKRVLRKRPVTAAED